MSQSSSSGETRPIFLPMRSTESVRIWLIFTHEGLGRFSLVNSSVRGKPARCGWLVIASAMTVPGLCAAGVGAVDGGRLASGWGACFLPWDGVLRQVARVLTDGALRVGVSRYAGLVGCGLLRGRACPRWLRPDLRSSHRWHGG